MDLHKELGRILDKNYISHGGLKSVKSTNHLYVPVTDNEKVFVKALHQYDEVAGIEHLQNGVRFSMVTEYGTVALMEKIQHQISNGFPLIFSVWEFEERTPAGWNLDLDLMASAGRELAIFHSFSRYKGLQEKSVDDVTNYGRGFISPGFISLNAGMQKMLKDVYDTLVAPGTDLLALNPVLNVVSHGNPNFNKFVTRGDGSQIWTQYEWVRSAPREYDLAQIYYDIVTQLKRKDLWHSFKTSYEKESGYQINDSYLGTFLSLLVGREILDVAFYQMTPRKAALVESYVREIKPLMTGKVDVQGIKNFPMLQF